MSSHLLWLLTKDSNSFLVKRKGITFSRAPGNLTNRNTFNQSSLSHKKSISFKKLKQDKETGKPAIKAIVRSRDESGRSKVRGRRIVVANKKVLVDNVTELAKTVNKRITARAVQRAASLVKLN